MILGEWCDMDRPERSDEEKQEVSRKRGEEG
jgi:hypothetical protein